jgi:SAM-dependent methyltransferase
MTEPKSIPPSGPVHKLRRIRYSIASTGLRATIADIANMWLAYDAEKDRSFDDTHGTDTAGSVQPEDLGIADDDTREHAIRYLPSPAKVTRWMLDNIGIDPAEFSFVDLGCGKGRVILIASERPFRRVMGVDISPELSAIARENVARFTPPSRRCQQVDVVNGDATTVDYPDSDILLHLYHPFEPEVLRKALANLEESWKAAPRRVVVAYLLYAAAHEAVADVFSEFGWLRVTRYEESVMGDYNWLFYST